MKYKNIKKFQKASLLKLFCVIIGVRNLFKGDRLWKNS